jgi:hypothetical protein
VLPDWRSQPKRARWRRRAALADATFSAASSRPPL